MSAIDDSPQQVPKTRFERMWRRIKADAWPIVLIVVLVLSVRSSFADHYMIPTGSMEPTLIPGDRVLVEKISYGIELPFTSIEIVEGRSPTRGEVVIFPSPQTGVRLIKRVVGVAGDHIEIRAGGLIVNGVAVGERDGERDTERLGDHHYGLELIHGGGGDQSWEVPEGQVVVLGDHRGRSQDSRSFGSVNAGEIYGRALGVYYRKGEWFTWSSL